MKSQLKKNKKTQNKYDETKNNLKHKPRATPKGNKRKRYDFYRGEGGA